MKNITKLFIFLTLISFLGTLKAEDLTLEQLSKFNGQNGNKAYIAIDGIIYDVSNDKKWKDGVHLPTNGKLKAGIDASEIIQKAPHKTKVLKKLPQVGKLIK